MTTSSPVSHPLLSGKFKLLLPLIFIGLGMFISGCATTDQNGGPNPDPLEGFNRPVHNLNHQLDTIFLKPVTNVYVEIVPEPVQGGIHNFFRNIAEINTILNALLQGKIDQAGSDTARFVVNSTIGIGGLFDVATGSGLPRHVEDFGQTLAVWGFGQGPYLVLPIMGPTTFRDAPGRLVGSVTNPFFYVDDQSITLPVGIVGMLDTRASLIGTIKTIDESAMDRYIYVREAYIQDRIDLIYDGNPPIEDIDYDEYLLDDELLEEE